MVPLSLAGILWALRLARFHRLLIAAVLCGLFPCPCRHDWAVGEVVVCRACLRAYSGLNGLESDLCAPFPASPLGLCDVGHLSLLVSSLSREQVTISALLLGRSGDSSKEVDTHS